MDEIHHEMYGPLSGNAQAHEIDGPVGQHTNIQVAGSSGCRPDPRTEGDRHHYARRSGEYRNEETERTGHSEAAER